MPKKQKVKKSKFPFAHPTRHGKLHFKKLLFIILIGAFGLVLAAAITAQVLYNKFVWDRLSENSSIKITLLIQSALEGLEDLKTSPEKLSDGTMFIKEARLKMPAETDDVRKLLYYYSPEDAGDDGHGYSWNTPESLEITTKQLSSQSRYKLMNGVTVDDLFKLVPEAQACSRGFLLLFVKDDENGRVLSGQKVLQDGRTVYVYNEPGCSSYEYFTKPLEAYLLQAQSY
jgi:hypothetical protein